MGNNCSGCCNRGGRRRPPQGEGRRKGGRPMTEPSPVFPTDRRSSSDSLEGDGVGVRRPDLLLPNSSPYTTSTTAAPSAAATPRSANGGGRGGAIMSDGGAAAAAAEKRLSLGGPAAAGVAVGGGGVPATISLDPLAGVATVVRGGGSGGNGGAGDGHHSGGSGKRSFVSRIPPLGRSGSGEFRNVSDSKISSLFCKYRDPSTVGSSSSSDHEAITTEGIEHLCRDLDLRPEEFRVLVLAWKCRAAQMCRLTRPEFHRGCRALRADTPRALQPRLTEAAAECLAAPDLFKDLYRFTFSFGLEPGQKVLPAEMACSLWQLVLGQASRGGGPGGGGGGVPPLLARWIAFIREHPEQVRGIPRDTWNMFLNLTESPAGAGGDLSLYDEEEAWPTLFDDFVEYENDRANQNVNKKWGQD